VGDVARADVRDPRAYLVRIVTRQALNRLRTLSRRREEYVGEWLPKPLLTDPHEDPARSAELANSVSMAALPLGLHGLFIVRPRKKVCSRKSGQLPVHQSSLITSRNTT
jgi:hypothetical protein